MKKEWWLEYTPYITREDFELFIDFLYREGWKSYIHFGNNIMCWDNFVKEGFVRSSIEIEGRGKQFCIDNNPQYMSEEKEIDLVSALNKNIAYEIY